MSNRRGNRHTPRIGNNKKGPGRKRSRQAAKSEMMGNYRPCPSCGSVWNSQGPTCRTCPVCGGFTVVHLNGAKLTREEFNAL